MCGHADGSDRAEKVLSIASSVAGVSGAAIGVVVLLRARTAPDSPPDGVPRGSIYSGRDIHIGHKVNTRGVLAVGGILTTLYLVLGATGVVRSAAAEPAADMASLTGRWRNSGGTVGNAGPLQITEQDAVLTVDRTGRF